MAIMKRISPAKPEIPKRTPTLGILKDGNKRYARLKNAETEPNTVNNAPTKPSILFDPIAIRHDPNQHIQRFKDKVFCRCTKTSAFDLARCTSLSENHLNLSTAANSESDAHQRLNAGSEATETRSFSAASSCSFVPLMASQ